MDGWVGQRSLVAKAWGQQQLPELLHIFESQLDSKAGRKSRLADVVALLEILAERTSMNIQSYPMSIMIIHDNHEHT